MLLASIDHSNGGVWDTPSNTRKHFLGLYRTRAGAQGGDFEAPLATFPSMTDVVFNQSASLIAGMGTGYAKDDALLYDVDVCTEVARLCSQKDNNRQYEHPNVAFGGGEFG